MQLTAGTRLGPYEIVAPIGAGGMGEVYRARDTRLDRAVAIKVISPGLASSPDARQRFEREARTISQLSHPHICALFDVGEMPNAESQIPNPYLVMELLEGETLAQRLVSGALPLELTLRYATQIADALDKAHRAGIVHRDLKPANIMITKAGVKLLDFGLAKAVTPLSPVTLSAETIAAPGPITGRGVIAGTVQYMAPEQLDGRAADARSDVYAFGAVLYEMATGMPAFRTALAAVEPEPLDRIMRGCLATDPDERWQSAHDVVLQLRAINAAPATQTALSSATPPRRRGWLRVLPWAIAIASMAAAIAALVRPHSEAALPSASVVRFSVPPPPGGTFFDNFENVPLALAPDGKQMAFVASDASGVQRVWVRALSDADPRSLAETDGATSVMWSPDSRSVAFFATGKLKRLDLPAGAAVTLCDVRGSGLSGSWGRNDQILFASVAGDAIYQVPAGGGTPATAMKPDRARGELRILFPWHLPDGQRFLYSARQVDGGAVMLAEPGKPPRQVLPDASNAQYAEPGYLVFVREGTLVAQRFDASRAELQGAPFSIAASVRYFYSTSAARFATASGALVYHSYLDQDRMTWVDRTGRENGDVGPRGVYISMRISPDGGRVLFSLAQPRIGTFDLWLTDLARGGEQRLTSDPTSEVNGVWQSDGRGVFFSADRGGPPHVFHKDLRTGTETEIVPAGGLQSPEDVSRDGGTLVYTDRTQEGLRRLWALALGPNGQKIALPPSGASQVRFSPNGRQMAFTSSESGKNEVYVAPYPATGEKTLVSTSGGSQPRWSRDGLELFFITPDRQLAAVTVPPTPAAKLGSPRLLFALPGRRSWKDYDVAPDGKRFLAIVTKVRGDEQLLTVVLNWTSEAARLDR